MTIDLGIATAGVGLALVATATVLRLFERSTDAETPPSKVKGRGWDWWTTDRPPLSPGPNTLSGRYFVIRGLTNIVELKR